MSVTPKSNIKHIYQLTSLTVREFFQNFHVKKEIANIMNSIGSSTVTVANVTAMNTHISNNPLLTDEFRVYNVKSDTVNNSGNPNKYLYAEGVLQSFLVYTP